jgi:hypothetical protein
MEEKVVNIDLLSVLENKVNDWVNKSFNFIQLDVVEKYCDNQLMEYIRNYSIEEMFEDWLSQMDSLEIIQKWADENDKQPFNEEVVNYELKNHFLEFYTESEWDEFKDWCIEEEHYPMWNTLFEFRDGYFNSEENIEKCMSVGLGVIEGLDSFNNILFMTSAGHSFNSAYWIPLYLKIYESDSEKFKDLDYSSL